MIPKSVGAKDKCPSCQMELICRETEFKGQKNLQWQYADREEAHFSWDFKAKKASCKESEPSTNTPKAATISSSPEKVELDKLALAGDQIAAINNGTADLAERLLVVFNTTRSVCERVGITHPATIGMIFNQVCETRRTTGSI